VGALLAAPLGALRLERVARRAMLAEVRRDAAAVAALLDVPAPRAALDRAHRRVTAELARPQRVLFRLAGAAGAVAAAAAVLLAVALWPPAGRPARVAPRAPGPVAAPAPRTEAILAAARDADDPAIGLLAIEADEVETELLASPAATGMDLRIEKLQKDVEDLWLELPPDPAPGP